MPNSSIGEAGKRTWTWHPFHRTTIGAPKYAQMRDRCQPQQIVRLATNDPWIRPFQFVFRRPIDFDSAVKLPSWKRHESWSMVTWRFGNACKENRFIVDLHCSRIEDADVCEIIPQRFQVLGTQQEAFRNSFNHSFIHNLRAGQMFWRMPRVTP